MDIILMRHGDALQGGADPARPLSEKGMHEAVAAGNFLRSINEIPNVMLHSSLLRSRETAERVEKALGVTGLLRLHYGLKPEDSPREFISEVLMEYAEHVGSDYTAMVVGHEPFMSGLASLLLWRSRCSLTFGTGTLLKAESYDPEKAWNLCFYIQANYLCRLLPGSGVNPRVTCK